MYGGFSVCWPQGFVFARSRTAWPLRDADCLYDTVPSPFGNDTRYLPQGEMRWDGLNAIVAK